MKAQWMRTAILMCALSGFVIGCAKDANMLQRTSFETDSDQPRMYTLIRQSSPIVDRLFEIEFLDPGIEVFVFTFG